MPAAAEAGPPPGAVDAEVAFRAALARVEAPRLDVPELAHGLRQAEAHLHAMHARLVAASGANSLDASMQHAAEAVMASEAAGRALLAAVHALGLHRTAAHRGEAALRQALGDAFAGLGVLQWPLEHHTVSALAPERVEITDAAQVPARYWRARDPEPDKQSIARTLRELGPGAVPGARLAPGPRSVSIRNRT